MSLLISSCGLHYEARLGASDRVNDIVTWRGTIFIFYLFLLVFDKVRSSQRDM